MRTTRGGGPDKDVPAAVDPATQPPEVANPVDQQTDEWMHAAETAGPPGPIPMSADPEKEIVDAIREDAARMLRRFGQILDASALPAARALRIAETYIKSVRTVVAMIAIPGEGEDDESRQGRNLVFGADYVEGVAGAGMPQNGEGRQARRAARRAQHRAPGGDPQASLIENMADLSHAQRVQALTTAMRDAERAQDPDLTARLRREVNALLPPETDPGGDPPPGDADLRKAEGPTITEDVDEEVDRPPPDTVAGAASMTTLLSGRV